MGPTHLSGAWLSPQRTAIGEFGQQRPGLAGGHSGQCDALLGADNGQPFGSAGDMDYPGREAGDFERRDGVRRVARPDTVRLRPSPRQGNGKNLCRSHPDTCAKVRP